MSSDLIRSRFTLRFLSLAACSAIAVCGCGEAIDLGDVSGVVVGPRGPVAGATVEFYPAQGRPSFGTTGPDGRYELTYSADSSGAVLGTHDVRVTTPSAPSTVRGREEVPEAAKTLALTTPVEVGPGENEVDLDLSAAVPLGRKPRRGSTEVLERSVR